MQKQLLLLLLLLTQFMVNAQDESDTIFVVRANSFSDNVTTVDTFLFNSPMTEHVLIGTCILPGTSGQIMSSSQGVYFQKVTKTDCFDNGEKAYTEESRINSFTFTDSTLIVDMTFIDNCCYEFLCDVELGDDGILHLNYTGYGSFCACLCCFGVNYHFEIDKSLEDYNLKGIMLGNDEKTLRKI